MDIEVDIERDIEKDIEKDIEVSEENLVTITDHTHERNSPTSHVVALALIVGVLAPTAACLQSSTSPCASMRCPLSTTCFASDGEQPRCVRENICGNGRLESESGEACDDGNTVNSDGCNEICQLEVCGDGVVHPGEVCDDGNTADGDGCNRTCQSLEVCGNGIVDGGNAEICDDGNDVDDDGCSNECRNDCGDGIVVADEECDDRGESATCNIDCTVSKCGDGQVNAHAGERCDTGEWDGVEASICSSECQSNRRIVAGRSHTCVLRATGAVRCWGYNGYGQLGYGHRDSIGDNETPASAGDVDVGGTVVELAAGDYHTCARTNTGSVRCWGFGLYGQLGYGNTNSIGRDETPASVGDVDVGSPVVQLVAGAYHTCALTHAGAVRCWGRGVYGQLGYGNTDSIGDDETPASAGDVDVGGIAIQLTAGDDHTCALLAGGTVRCWGSGVRLGYGNTSNIGDNETPASAGDVDVGGPVVQLTAGGGYTCALLSTGTVRCWGYSRYGQLGYGNTDSIGDDEIPASAGDVEIRDESSGTVVQLAAGGSHTCALLSTGAVRCWGSGDAGQLGYGFVVTIGDDEVPADAGDVDVGGPAGEPVVQLAAGGAHTCALLASDAVRCWGSNSSGQLGYGVNASIGDDETPASAGDVDAGGRVEQIVAGSQHTCALLDTGAVRCWGRAADGRLGYGNVQNVEAPAHAGDVPLGAPVAQLATDESHSCALLSTGTVRCWGNNHSGQLGYGNTDNIGDDEPPASVADVDVGGAVAQVAIGGGHTCALLSTDTVRCWGDNDYGQLGYGNTRDIGDNETPASAGDIDVGGDVTQIAASSSHTCALLETGAVRCWGWNYFGQLGYGDTDDIGDNEHPASAGDIDVGGDVTQIASGRYHTCALLKTGAVRCWGAGRNGRLGYGNTSSVGDNELPASAGDVNVGGLVTQIAAGHYHTCALLDTSKVRCWGYGGFGRLGYGNTDDIGDDEHPASAGDVDVGGPVAQIAAGSDHTCAVLTTGTVRCWGSGHYGQLGYGYNDIIGDNETPASAGDVPLHSP